LKRFLVLLSAIIAVGAVFIFAQHVDADGSKGREALQREINTMILNHDLVRMEQLSADDSTFAFLSGLPRGAECSRTSDLQDGEGQSVYYITEIEGQSADVAVSISRSPIFGNRYTITQIEIRE